MFVGFLLVFCVYVVTCMTWFSGVLGLVWCVGWVVFTSDSPSQHPRITESERRYIEGSADRPQQKVSGEKKVQMTAKVRYPSVRLVVIHC